MNWLLENKEWLFSGAGLSVIGVIYYIIKKPLEVQPIPLPQQTIGSKPSGSDNPVTTTLKTIKEYKDETRILFIDDDTKFKVAKILSKSGWVHTKLIKDAETLDIADITEAHILFIDVQGVGVAMGFNDEGLGLALAIKKKYPKKKVVIYSAETQGDRFHEALRTADNFLPKNADPYEFQKIVEEYTIGNRAY